MVNRYHLLVLVLLNTMTASLDAMYLLHPYEQMWRPEIRDDFSWQYNVILEHGFGTQAFNEDGNMTNVLRIWNSSQDALAMLNGFSPLSAIGQLRTKIGAPDDGVRGHFLVDGDLRYHAGVGLSVRMGLPYHLCVGLHLPFYAFSLRNVCWQNQTKNLTVDDARVQQYLTNNFFANVTALGDGLNLQGWQRSGLGDLTVLAEWVQNFKQQKDFLHNVLLQARFGVGIPTGKKTDEDKIFALSFGTDGGWYLVIGGGLTASVANYLRAGFDVELTHIFSVNKLRRIKTNVEQTELLLLQKAYALKNYGLTQRFNLFLEAYRFFDGLSAKVGYQFIRHGDDSLSVQGNNFSTFIANTAKSLEEWTQHNLFFFVSYDGDHDPDAWVHPYASLFVELPFNGQFIAHNKVIGAVLSIDF